MKLLVTGATGFIGRRAVALLARGGRFAVTACGRQRPTSLPPGVAFETVDLLEPGAGAKLIRRTLPSHLLHLAWNAEPGRFWAAPDNVRWAAATLDLYDAFAEAAGRRAVFAGSCAEYDWTGPGMLAEDAPTRPATLYGIVKDATRRVVLAGARPQTSVAWGRIFWLYGPGEQKGRLVSDVIDALLDGRPVETSEGRQQRDFLHVDDVAAAFEAALLAPYSGIFNIGSGEAVPVRRVVSLLADQAGRPDLVRFGARPSPAGDPPLLMADPSVLRHQIGFVPAHGLAAGLGDTFRMARDRG